MSGAEVFTLIATLGRLEGDGLPAKATGGAMLLYAAAADEQAAVRESVALLKAAGLNVLEMEGLGTRAEREGAGDVIGDEDLALMERAASEGAVIVAQSEAFYD